MNPTVQHFGGEQFWSHADQLVASHELVIERPRGSRHPSWPDLEYPLDYGFLTGTQAIDGGGIDVWRGSLRPPRVSGVILTVDLRKRDAEVKLLVGCTADEMARALAMHQVGAQAGLLVPRPPDGGGGSLTGS